MTAEQIRDRVRAYYGAVTAGDVEGVCAMYARDAEMRDPVGAPSATDDASRRQRYAGIGATFEAFAIAADDVQAGGDEAAARWTSRARTKAGRDVTMSGISTFVFDAEGKIARMSAYWDPAAFAAALTG